MAKILSKYYENHKAQFPKLNVFVGQKSILRHYYIQNGTAGIQIRVHSSQKVIGAPQTSQFISVKVKNILRKFQAQFWEK